jgi:uncharacterized protein
MPKLVVPLKFHCRLVLAMVVFGLAAQSARAQSLADIEAQANQGIAVAQATLGTLYASGQDVPQDYTKAIYWYKKAASQGFAGAEYYLGVSYDTGQGVPQDYTKAI